MEDHNYQLISDYFDKSITDDGLIALQEWIEAHPENLDTFIETLQILGAAKTYFELPPAQEESWRKVHQHITETARPVKRRQHRLRWAAAAAAVLLMASFSLVWYTRMSPATPHADTYATLSNPDGQHSRIILPDSSVVYLGGGSTVKYVKNFLGAKRTVYLDGEAFFDVVHQAARPFIVKSGDISTVVLGTSFNVKAFALQKQVEVTVNTGKVGVMATVKGKQQLIRYLTPDEQLAINTNSGMYTFGRADAKSVSGWVKNDFIFHNTPLSEIALSLAHHYGVQIEFTEAELGKMRLTAKFINMPLQEVLDNLSVLGDLAYTRKGNQVFISNSNQRGGKIMR
jgi:transmembrane sensor